MAFNNSNRSLASQRFINSINAIVIQEEDEGWFDWLLGGVGSVSLIGAALLRYIKYKRKCAKLLADLMKQRNIKAKDFWYEMSALAQMMRETRCTGWWHVWQSYQAWKAPIDAMQKGLAPQENLQSPFVKQALNIIDRMLEAKCLMKDILKLIKDALPEGKISDEDWEKLGQLEELERPALTIAIAAWLAEQMRKFQRNCPEACNKISKINNYLNGEFPDSAAEVLTNIAYLIALIAALTLFIKVAPEAAAAAGIAGSLIAANAALADAVEEAKMVPDGMSTDEFIEDLKNNTEALECESPENPQGGNEEAPTSDETTPGGGTPPGGGTTPGGGTLPAGGMPPANYKPNSTTPTTNSNASRQIFNRKLR